MYNNLRNLLLIILMIFLLLTAYIKFNTKHYVKCVIPDVTLTYGDPDIVTRHTEVDLYDINDNKYHSNKSLIYNGKLIIWYRECCLKLEKRPLDNTVYINKIINCVNYPNRINK